MQTADSASFSNRGESWFLLACRAAGSLDSKQNGLASPGTVPARPGSGPLAMPRGRVILCQIRCRQHHTLTVAFPLAFGLQWHGCWRLQWYEPVVRYGETSLRMKMPPVGVQRFCESRSPSRMTGRSHNLIDLVGSHLINSAHPPGKAISDAILIAARTCVLPDIVPLFGGVTIASRQIVAYVLVSDDPRPSCKATLACSTMAMLGCRSLAVAKVSTEHVCIRPIQASANLAHTARPTLPINRAVLHTAVLHTPHSSHTREYRG